MPAAVLAPRLRELVAVRIAQLNGASNSLVHHARAAIALGESPGRLAALAHWRRSSLFSEDEQAALGLAEALALPTNDANVAEARQDAAAYFDPVELTQLVYDCAVASAWDRLEVAAGAARR
jgi:AhpD family alkylhydroperoxidase